MIKKLTIAAVVLPLCMAAQAREGAYIGANLAWSQIDIEAIVDTPYSKGSDKDYGAGGAIYAGYGRMGANGFLALEINVDASDAKISEKESGTAITYEKKESFGAGVLMGANLPHNFAAYARVGWQQSDFRLGVDVGASQASVRKEHDGIRYGVGAMIPLHEILDLRLEANHTYYNKKHYADNLQGRPKENQIQAGLTLRF